MRKLDKRYHRIFDLQLQPWYVLHHRARVEVLLQPRLHSDRTASPGGLRRSLLALLGTLHRIVPQSSRLLEPRWRQDVEGLGSSLLSSALVATPGMGLAPINPRWRLVDLPTLRLKTDRQSILVPTLTKTNSVERTVAQWCQQTG